MSSGGSRRISASKLDALVVWNMYVTSVEESAEAVDAL